jgi:hypothetical protein
VSRRVSQLQPSKDEVDEWKPPNLPAVELQRFEQTLNECDSNAPFPSLIDDDLVMKVLVGMVETAEVTMKAPAFVDLDASYRDCMKSQGLRVGEYIRDEIVLAATATPNEIRKADSVCRLPLYERFIQLDVDLWSRWLEANDASLKQLREMWDDVFIQAGIEIPG